MMEVLMQQPAEAPEIRVESDDADGLHPMEIEEEVEPYEEISRALVDGLNPVDSVVLTADRGYLLWINPRGSIEVKFRYGRSGENFNCFIDPQHQGVTIYELCGTYRKEMVVDGRQPLSKNTNPHHVKPTGVRRRENNFEFRSRNSEVRLVLETVRDSPPQQAFKFNYVLTL
ncbi:uncharacterized protein LOC110975170 isoform X2 [Acanthaster planci]|uniref:Uncharacterized protein LOC110975170 isoform X2 n=1 Tax=Acanthaster planci TaxID=133434 RepID=A0A8B7XQH0_ACAPL|nr:uncharacterized protein LOC110975170 isoform X2 [Acanthaster planci]